MIRFTGGDDLQKSNEENKNYMNLEEHSRDTEEDPSEDRSVEFKGVRFNTSRIYAKGGQNNANSLMNNTVISSFAGFTRGSDLRNTQ